MLLQFVTFFATHFSCWLIAVFVQSFRSFYFTTLLHSHRNANPTQELSFIHSFRFIRSFHYRHFCLSTLQIHVLTAWLHFVQLSLSTPHKNALPFIHSLQLHSFYTSSPCFFQRTVRAKNTPNQLPAAPCHSALRYPCQGHSLNTQSARPQRTGSKIGRAHV